jgi:hypothetical protein
MLLVALVLLAAGALTLHAPQLPPLTGMTLPAITLPALHHDLTPAALTTGAVWLLAAATGMILAIITLRRLTLTLSAARKRRPVAPSAPSTRRLSVHHSTPIAASYPPRRLASVVHHACRRLIRTLSAVRRQEPTAASRPNSRLSGRQPERSAPRHHEHNAETSRTRLPTAPDIEEQALAAAAAIARPWQLLGIRGSITAIEVARGGIRAFVEPAPEDEAPLEILPRELRAAGLDARWRGDSLTMRHAPIDATLRNDQFLLAPLLTGGGRDTRTRFVALAWLGAAGMTRRHLIISGEPLHDALHALMISLLYTTPPDALAISVCGEPALEAIYRAAPHWVEPPGSPDAMIRLLDRRLRRERGRSDLRPLLLVVSAPDAARLAGLVALAGQVRADAPLHLCVACRAGHAAPAAAHVSTLQLTSGMRGSRSGARWTNGVDTVAGAARLLGDDAARAMIAAIPPFTGHTRPVFWDAPPPSIRTAPYAPPATAATHAGDSLVGKLAAALGDAETAPQWPAGPQGMSPQAIGELVERLLTAPEIVAAAPSGVTRRRLAALLPPPQREAARVLYAWFDAAGILAEPLAEELRMREPRPLRSDNRNWIAAQLAATPIPSQELP